MNHFQNMTYLMNLISSFINFHNVLNYLENLFVKVKCLLIKFFIYFIIIFLFFDYLLFKNINKN